MTEKICLRNKVKFREDITALDCIKDYGSNVRFTPKAKRSLPKFEKLIKVDEFLPHSSNGGSLNSSKSHYSLMSSSKERLLKALEIPNEKFSKYIDTNFTKISEYMTKLQKEKRKKNYFKTFKKMSKLKRRDYGLKSEDEKSNTNLSQQVILNSGKIFLFFMNFHYF